MEAELRKHLDRLYVRRELGGEVVHNVQYLLVGFRSHQSPSAPRAEHEVEVGDLRVLPAVLTERLPTLFIEQPRSHKENHRHVSDWLDVAEVVVASDDTGALQASNAVG